MTPDDVQAKQNNEPSVAQVEAFKEAWEAEDARQRAFRGADVRLGDRTRAGLRAVLALESGQRTYPFLDGPHLVIGPECFTGDGVEVDQTVISWRGENYYVPERAGLVLTQEEAALAVETISALIQETYDRETLRLLGALAHKLDPDFPEPEDDDEDDVS